MTRAARETPMMRQYLAIKARHPDAFLFYRMGDFYELFFDDAERAAPLLDITLTTRDRDKPDPIPMCGVPVHSADVYIKRLASMGHRVALCEQVEDAKARAGGKGLVRREVVEVVTPGLVGDPAGLEASREVVVLALALETEAAGLAVMEASTGSFRVTTLGRQQEALPPLLLDELDRIGPREILLGPREREVLEPILRRRLPAAALTSVEPESYEPGRLRELPEGLEAQAAAGRRAAAAVLAYLAGHQPAALRHVPRVQRYDLAAAMVLDAQTRRHLELFESMEDRSRRGTLIERLDATRTPPGARRLARWLAYPLVDPEAIRARQARVAHLAGQDRPRARLREALGPVRDLERILARCARPAAEPRDLVALRSSLAALPALREALEGQVGPEALWPQASPPVRLPLPEGVPDVVALLHEALVDEPRPRLRGSRGAGETGYMREGFRSELDGLRESTRKGREWIAGLEAQERERLEIPSLKVRFHPVHGYAIEVTRANLDRVPREYERKQTLANAERFTTPELREMESTVRGAHERAAALERELFEEVRRRALDASDRIRAAAEAVAELDALQSLAEVARRDDWVPPQVDAGLRLELRSGRHPVVEAMLRRDGEDFVPNDTELDPEATRILLLTGPNMSGKSTYLRQVALLVLLAQIGSFVPAESARVGVVDRIFTRVGASDRLAQGESTFMVEMRETAEILEQASRRSLVILDEIGRGTSTFDGLSIAWAVAEYLHDAPGLGPRTLFATHYHELAELTRTRSGVRNAHFEAREWKDEILFMRRLVPGEASRSYGIQVARLAGLPPPVLERAREVLRRLEAEAAQGPATESPQPQLPLFQGARSPWEEEVLGLLRRVEPERTTPLEALALLERMQRRLVGEEDR